MEGKTDGVFQLESAGIKSVLQQLRPERLEDIIACIALYRPGPMESIDTFIARKNGKEPIRYITPQLQPILDNTYGCIVYQEQVMQIFRAMGGYSYARADLVRRAMSKKKADVLEAERDRFTEGCSEHGISAGIAEQVFDEMASFAKYAFNKSHATAYAFISYRTAYMKAHYPAEYAAALLNAQQDADPSRCAVPLLPPDINESRAVYSVSGGRVRFGLMFIKNVGQLLAEAIENDRKMRGPFADFGDFVDRMAGRDLNKRSLESLIRAGAFDAMGHTRRALIEVYEQILGDAQARRSNNITGQLDLFSLGQEDAGKPAHGNAVPSMPEYSQRELIGMEKEYTGICFSGNLLDDYKMHIAALSPESIASVMADEETGAADRAVRICGVITARNVKKTKAGETMAFLKVEDSTAACEVIMFPKTYVQYGGFAEADRAVCVEGRVRHAEDEPPKIIMQKMEWLTSDRDRAIPPKPAAPKKTGGRRLCLRVPSMSCPEMTAVMTLLYSHRGNIPVILFDASRRVYAKSDGCFAAESPELDSALRRLLGDSSVLWQET